MKRGIISAVVVLLAVGAVTGCETKRPSGPRSGRTPVVFVHGWNGDETAWDAAVAQFKAAGYTAGDLTVLYYDSSLSAADAAKKLTTEVDHLRQFTGASKVDVVSHSFGSMVTKSCIEVGGCAGKVRRWMSLAGADNGTSIAGLCTAIHASCRDMTGATSTIRDLQAAWPQITTQNVKVAVQWSRNDGTIIPAENSKLPAPAVNTEVDRSLTHNDLTKNRTVIATTITFLQG